jgi:hypothetical protein
LPTPGGAEDFPRLIRTVTSFDEAKPRLSVVGLLFAIRQMLGELFGWDEAADDPTRPSLRLRLAEDLRRSPSTVTPAMGFSPLYQLDDEWAAELINGTVHGVIHLGWVRNDSGGYRAQMAILVKPNGSMGRAYMAAIMPFRYLIVYPRMLKSIGRNWLSQSADRV